MRWIFELLAGATILAVLLGNEMGGYSVLSHEALIDSAWDRSIAPVLLRRFPRSTQADLKRAHAHAYGGAIIQDLGYYPFGSHLFSDLVHYVRTGDFIRNMLLDAKDLDEYAFALGSLAHYVADTYGHPIGINPSVGLLYPKLRARYGDEVTYADNPADHLKTEFAFDVLQVAQGHYAPEAYHDFIGFQVSKDLLDRAFRKTYGLPLGKVFTSVDLALGTYRHTVGILIPEMTKVAWAQKKGDLVKTKPGLTRERFIYNLSRASYEKEWGDQYERPGAFARILAWLLRLLPKVGPFKALAFRPPTSQAEKLFMQSFNVALARYRDVLQKIGGGTNLHLRDTNFDTGEPTTAGRYRMADEAVCKLMEKLSKEHFRGVDAALRQNLVAYWGAKNPTNSKAAEALRQLRAQEPGSSVGTPDRTDADAVEFWCKVMCCGVGHNGEGWRQPGQSCSNVGISTRRSSSSASGVSELQAELSRTR